MSRIRLKSILKDGTIVLLVSLLLLFSIEGFFSFVITTYDLWNNPRIIAEKMHTEYDPEIGWINRENCFIQDMYGPGIYLRTNSQRFRNNQDFQADIPIGKRRWICAGDSFTLGYGVDNEHTWGSFLSSQLPHIEAVNMGQGGYAVDQAYLWYMRDGAPLQHDVFVLAFITYDFDRMTKTRSSGYSRPRLSIVDGKITQQNFPIPRPGSISRYLPGLRFAIRELSIIRMTRWLGQKFQRIRSGPPDSTIELTQSIFNNLNRTHRQSNRTVLLVHLPLFEDYRDSEISSYWRHWLNSNAEKYGWNYIDLIEDFRNLEPDSINDLFIQSDLPGYVASSGHYTEKGHQYIANILVERISENPSLADLVQAPERDSDG